MSSPIDETFGAAYIGIVVAALLLGSYTYLITFWQQPAKLRIVIWSLLAEVLFNGLTGFCVQWIWKLSGTKVWLTVVVISLVFAEFACVIAFAVIASDTMINKLTIFAVNTGALTSLCAVASLISIIAAPNTFIYISFFFSMGRLYTNSLLATLNARKMIRDAAEGINTTTGDNISLPCKGRASSSKLVFQRSRNLNTNISIQVDTTREFLSDLEHGVVRDRHVSDFKHDEVEIEEDLSEVNLSNGDIESNISSGIECTAV
ncbi:hypothetical protein HHX47_DHR7000668 [Lentinula edodes]|nr:hypothetical protein HHX47_DHR7000668 [Lentinula edodes]